MFIYKYVYYKGKGNCFAEILEKKRIKKKRINKKTLILESDAESNVT